MELAAAESQNAADVEQDDDDAEYYRTEVGAEPEQGIIAFIGNGIRFKISEHCKNS